MTSENQQQRGVESSLPTDAECRLMLRDLRQAGADYPGLLAYSPRSDRVLNVRTRRLVWLLWVLICRPGQLRTTADIVLSGRNRASLDPAGAGQPWSGAGSEEVFGGGVNNGAGI